jgi:hypothetical protein
VSGGTCRWETGEHGQPDCRPRRGHPGGKHRRAIRRRAARGDPLRPDPAGTPCNGGDTAAYWVVARADDTCQYTIFGGTAEAALGNGGGNNITFQPEGTGGDQNWGECISPGNC